MNEVKKGPLLELTQEERELLNDYLNQKDATSMETTLSRSTVGFQDQSITTGVEVNLPSLDAYSQIAGAIQNRFGKEILALAEKMERCIELTEKQDTFLRLVYGSQYFNFKE